MATQTHESLAANATAFLERVSLTMECPRGGQEEIRTQARSLIEWARQNKVFLNANYTAGLQRQEPETTEHIVFLGVSNNQADRVIKCTYPGMFGWANGPNGRRSRATPLFYLRRLALMNQVFASDLRLEGVGEGAPRFDWLENPSPYIVTSQGYIAPSDKNCPYPTEEEIEAFMFSMGFQRLDGGYYNWERGDLTVLDARIDNFINSARGIVPIDLIIGKTVPTTS